MNRSLEIAPLQSADSSAVAALLAQALHFRAASMAEWLQALGTENVHVAKIDKRAAAGLGIINMGQWFGGRAVPTAGITAVGVAPEYRGQRVGYALMQAMLTTMYERGVPLSTLYPATTQFYRTLGYERAGSRTIYEYPLDQIAVRERTLDVVPVAEPTAELLEPIYTRWAGQQAGTLQRDAVMWRRTLLVTDQPVYTYLIERAGQPQGYVVFTQGGQREHVAVRDWCVLSREAGLRLLMLLGGHRSIASTLRWPGAPSDMLLHLLPEERHKIFWSLEWLLRIVDVAQALGARGYPPGLEVELHFDVRDDVLTWNNRRLVLHIDDGQAQVRDGGVGNVQIDVRGLAALYSGYLTPDVLHTLGHLDADQAQRAQLALAFSGPRPWMPDMF